jgi:hypothetical protein
MVDEGNQDRLHQPADRRRRTLAEQQQVDRLAKRQAAHDLVERIPANEDLVRRDARQRGSPLAVRFAWLRPPFDRNWLPRLFC